MLHGSMARFGALCLAVVCMARAAVAEDAPPPGEPAAYSAWQGQAPHAPPPPIMLGAAPAPELPAAEYARRPFELVPELLLGFASCADGSVSDARCSGLSAGLGLGGTLLWRVSPYFAFGGSVADVAFGFHPAAESGLQQARANGVFYGILGRVYVTDHGLVEPYLELGLGGGSVSTSAREADDERYDETTGGSALRVGGAVEFFVSRHLRLGPAFDWTRFDVGHVRRCAGSQCAELDEASYGHGVGFSSVSVRISLLLGPGL
jgi:opacity protein-like surface antigen